MTEEWLIDGCNLLHSFPSKNWCERLAGFASAKQCPVTFVLDGVGDDAEFEKSRTRFFRVVYANGSSPHHLFGRECGRSPRDRNKQVVGSADCLIERYLFQHKGKASFTVVTNDRMVTNIACGFGALVIKNNRFVEILRETEDNTKTILWEEKMKSHGFHRPFDGKLKDIG